MPITFYLQQPPLLSNEYIQSKKLIDIYYQSNKILIIHENLIHKVEFKDRIDNLLAIINRLNITITDVELAFLHILSSHKNTALNQLDQYLENTQLRPYFEKYSFCRTPDYQDDFYQIVSKLSETNLKNPNYFIKQAWTNVLIIGEQD